MQHVSTPPPLPHLRCFIYVRSVLSMPLQMQRVVRLQVLAVYRPVAPRYVCPVSFVVVVFIVAVIVVHPQDCPTAAKGKTQEEFSCTNCRDSGHTQCGVPMRIVCGTERGKASMCFNCGQANHLRAECQGRSEAEILTSYIGRFVPLLEVIYRYRYFYMY